MIVTSATIDPQRFAAHFAAPDGTPAPIIEVSGRTYPVEVRYRPLVSEDPDEEDRTLEAAILHAVDELAALDSPNAPPGDILVFLPGEREVRETADELAKHHVGRPGEKTEVLPLYARLSADEQHRVFESHPGRRRIVLATNVAETSLTVPGIRYVIDSGLARISRYSTRTRVQGLPVEAISQSSAAQRAGRCGRIAPGVCIRLYAQEDFDQRDAFTPPEIVRTNLASVILQMKALHLGELETYPFVERPHERAIQDGYDTLVELGALDDKNRLTALGHQLAKLPIDPRLARMVLAGEREGCLREVLVIAAALSVQDPRERPRDKREDADRVHEKFVNAHLKPPEPAEGAPVAGTLNAATIARETAPEGGSDFMTLVNIWSEFQRQREHLSSSKLRKWCKANFLGFMRMREWADVHQQLHRLAAQMGHRLNTAPADEGSVHRALLTGLLSNIGRYDEVKREYVGAQSSLFSIFPGSAMFSARARWIMAAERVRTTKVYARTVARIKPEWVEEFARHLVTRSFSEASWNERTGTVHVFEKVFLYGLEIVPKRRVNLAHVDPPAARQLFIQNALVEGNYQTGAPYAAHNKAILEEAKRLEAKLRRRDLTIDLGRRADFFERIVPPAPQATSGGSFERWRGGAERRNPKILFLRLQDLLKPGAVLPSPDDTPGTLTLSKASGGGTCPLDYRFEPGEHEDGVTITIPLAALNMVNPAELEWLVPGWLGDKVTELLRTLPKEIRRRLGPVPPVIVEFMGQAHDHTRPLCSALAEYCSKLAGVPVSPGDFAPDSLPEWMRMRVLVVDGRGRPLASGRDLLSLRRELRLQIGESLVGAGGREFNRKGMNDWEFGDLPESVEVDAGGARVRAFPGLVDEGKTAGLRLFDSKAAADEAMIGGLRRLFMLRNRGEIKAALVHAAGAQKLMTLGGGMTSGGAPALIDQLALMVCQRVFLPAPEDAGSIRTFQGFTERLNSGFGSIVSVCLDICPRVLAIFEALHRVRLKLDSMRGARAPEAWKGPIEGVTNQLGNLVPDGFLVSTPPEILIHFPRYLRGVESRLEKLSLGKAANDQKWAAELRPHLRRWLDMREQAKSLSAQQRAALDAYRWMLEEYRVALFAQELRAGFNLPAVSAKKLDEQWLKVVQAP